MYNGRVDELEALLRELVEEEPLKFFSAHGMFEFGQQCVFCETDHLDVPSHKPDCLIERVRRALAGDAPIRIITDHRVAIRDMMMMPASSQDMFQDRSFVREGCTCDYCTWTPETK